MVAGMGLQARSYKLKGYAGSKELGKGKQGKRLPRMPEDKVVTWGSSFAGAAAAVAP